MNAGLHSRRLAAQILEEIEESDAYANLLLPARLSRSGLNSRDAAFVTELVYGSTRQRGRLNAIIELAADRPIGKIDRGLDILLRLGAYQILDLAVADHAAVDTTVQLTRRYFGASRAGFVNAVLRRIASETDWPARLAETHHGDALLAATTSHPEWIVRAYRDSLLHNGRSVQELEDALAANNLSPAVTLVARPGLAQREDIPGTEPTSMSPYGAIMSGGNPAGLAPVQRGEVGVQDEGSQLAALALAWELMPLGRERWWDMCAGPGGKTALLGALAGPSGHRLLATEIQPHRADLVRTSTQAVRHLFPDTLTIETVDALQVPTDPGFDKVLLDAPCTGLGALRRRPESRWRRTPGDLAHLTQLQRALITKAIAATTPGGVITYVTCSPHLSETHLIVDAALATGKVTAVDTGKTLGIEAGERVQLWPHIHGTDAMFIASLRRTSA